MISFKAAAGAFIGVDYEEEACETIQDSSLVSNCGADVGEDVVTNLTKVESIETDWQ